MLHPVCQSAFDRARFLKGVSSMASTQRNESQAIFYNAFACRAYRGHINRRPKSWSGTNLRYGLRCKIIWALTLRLADPRLVRIAWQTMFSMVEVERLRFNVIVVRKGIRGECAHIVSRCIFSPERLFKKPVSSNPESKSLMSVLYELLAITSEYLLAFNIENHLAIFCAHGVHLKGKFACKH